MTAPSIVRHATLEGARLAWKLLAGREGVERNYWALEDGRWTKKGLSH